MSDTPRTDKETGKSMGSDSIVYASFARQLERELTEAREQRDRLAAIAGELIEMIRMNVAWGRFFEKCTLEQLDEHLKPWIEKIAAVKGGKP